MKIVELKVSKANVYNEVAKTTSYTGAKMQGDEGAYERIFTTDEDRQMLERFWVEAGNAVTEELKQFLVSVSEQPEDNGTDLTRDYKITLELSSSYDTTLTNSIETSLFSFFVSTMVAKWYKFTNKSEQESWVGDALGMMNDIKSKIYYRKKPIRVVPT